MKPWGPPVPPAGSAIARHIELARIARIEAMRVQAEADHAAAVLTGPCPSCKGARARDGDRCLMCDGENSVSAPRSWWINVIGGEP